MRDGLIPNLFPEGKTEGLYHTADATLWFFHAIDRYHCREWRPIGSADGACPSCSTFSNGTCVARRLHRASIRAMGVETGRRRLRAYVDGCQGRRLGGDAEARQGRRNQCAVVQRAEAVGRVLAADGESEQSARVGACARQARESFNARFWYEPRKHLFDVIDGPDGDDAACRPNQLLAISLKYPILDEARWAAVLEVARAKLLTPVGLRTLSPDHKDYKPKYDGDLHARDAAYHQGTVWAWLIGPFIDAWLKVHPRRFERRR